MPHGPAGNWVPMSRRLIAFFCAAVCLSAGAVDAVAGETQVKLDAAYTATLLGIPLGQIYWTVEVGETRYAAVGAGSTAGLLRVFARGHGTAMAHGTFNAHEAVASDFLVNYQSGSSSDEIKIAFSGGKAKETLAHPPKPDSSGVPLTDANRVGVVDPMTALLIRVPGSGDLAAPAACDRKIAVFDGRMRFDLQLVFKRIEQVRASTGYQGPAVVCALYFSPLAGYDIGRSGVRYLKAERDMEMWLAPITGTRLVAPFRIAVPTPLGLGVLQATRFVLTPQPEPSSAMNAR